MSESRAPLSLRLVDALFYAVGVTGLLFVLGTAVSFAVGAGWVGVKWFLFVTGMVGFGVAGWQLRPPPPGKDERAVSIEPDDETPFQAAIQRLPPFRSRPLDPNERYSAAARLFLGSVLTLAVSFLMERVFGVGVVTA